MSKIKKTTKKVLKFMLYSPEKKYNFQLPELNTSDSSIENSNTNSNLNNELKKLTNTNINLDTSLTKNLEFINVHYNSKINSDIVIRKFNITINNTTCKAFLIYIDGMSDPELINNYVLKPLMLHSNNIKYSDKTKLNTISTALNKSDSNNNLSFFSTNKKNTKNKIKSFKKINLSSYIYSSLIPENDVKTFNNFEEIFGQINIGDSALFVDTLDTAYVIDTKGFEKRSINPPNNEIIIRGAQEAFIENIRTNTSLLRRYINNENLVIEKINLGVISNTRCAICYIKGIVNPYLVSEIKYRMNNLSIDYLISSGQLEQLIQDNENISIPQILNTERPDRAAISLLEGKAVILVNGSPYALVMPSTLLDFFSTTEDTNLNYKFSRLTKILRIMSCIIALLLPGIYVSITYFHTELIPTELLFAIISARSAIPFSIIVELLIMELSFELIREAGLRVPSPIGPTISIVGALILGDAAVNASIVSPFLIIIVALTGLASFAIPNYSLGSHLRLTRFIYIFLGAVAGFLGIAFGLFIHFSILSAMNSFGVPYLAPYIPITHTTGNRFLISPFWKKETRLDALNPERIQQQKKYSMQWKKEDKNE